MKLVVIQISPVPRIESMLQPTPRVNQTDAEGVRELTLRSLFDTQESPLLRYAFSLTGRRAVAEEIVQEVFLQLHIRWGEVDSPREWLFRSVRNRAFNHLRDHRREILRIDDRDPGPADVTDQSPAAVLERLEATGVLRQAVEQLGEADRRLVKLKYFEGQSYRNISDQTGLSIGNVGYRLHHILKELAGKLGSLGMDTKS